ncbi:MAG: phosphatase PAP2 family protein [Marmoricola sp.]
MRRSTAAVVAATSLTGYGILGAVFSGHPSRAERRTFRAINHGVGPQPWLRMPQQLGTPWALPVAGLLATVRGERRLAVAALLALPLEKGLEVGMKKVVDRPRPAQVLTPEIRDDAPTEGPSYPSGHAAIAACAVWLLGFLLPPPAVAVLGGCAGLTALTRVHQGAHLPTDAVGGAALGVGVGALLTAALGL